MDGIERVELESGKRMGTDIDSTRKYPIHSDTIQSRASVGAGQTGEDWANQAKDRQGTHAYAHMGPHSFSSVVAQKWPSIDTSELHIFPIHGPVYSKVKAHNLPNYLGARITIPSQMNIKNWQHLLQGYQDAGICKFLQYGWPIGYTSESLPTPTAINHKSAIDYAEQVQSFIDNEIRLGAMLGPFTNPPFKQWFQTSPLMSRPKKEGEKRRIIIDLSFPPGAGVNAGIEKHIYEGEYMAYTLPTVLDMGREVASCGRGAFLWKCDLERAYRQLRIDPLAYPLLGIRHSGSYYIDICPSFGCRVSGGAQQRVSEAVCHIMRQAGCHVLAYVDDFGGAHRNKKGAQEAFQKFHDICAELGLSIAHDKSAAPSTYMEWLGFGFDTEEMVMIIPETKLREVIEETKGWSGKAKASRCELQRLAGRLAHISTCITHARKFMFRTLLQLRTTPEGECRQVSSEMRKDLAWFQKCAQKLNAKRLIIHTRDTYTIECDACLKGGGGFSVDRYYDIAFPAGWAKRLHISQIEAANVLLAVKTLLPSELIGVRLLLKTDNAAAATVLLTGRTHDEVMARCSRELAMIAINNELDLDVIHVPGTELVLADALSRRHFDSSMNSRAAELVERMGLIRLPAAGIENLFDCEL